jgi:hypothetical protein
MNISCQTLVAHTCNHSYSGGSENRRITVRNQPGQIVHETLPQKKTFTNKGDGEVGGVAQGVGPEFKSLDQKKCVNPI